MARRDVVGLEMWPAEDPAPALGRGFCILTFRKHARNVTFGFRRCGKKNERLDIETRNLLMQLKRGGDIDR